MAQSFGLVLKGNYNSFYANTILRSKEADVCLPTADEGPNTETVLLNSIVHRWSGKGGPTPTGHPSHFAAWGGMDDAAVDVGQFVDFEGFDFRPKPTSTSIVGVGIVHPPQVPGENGSHVDAGAYQHTDTAASRWIPGCTFSPACKDQIPAPPPPPPPPPPCVKVLGFGCSQDSYCGPKNSFYWSGSLSLASCTAKCASNSTCHCFDYLASSSSRDERTAASSNQDTDGAGGFAACRLHTSANDVTYSGEGYTAYFRNSSGVDINSSIV